MSTLEFTGYYQLEGFDPATGSWSNMSYYPEPGWIAEQDDDGQLLSGEEVSTSYGGNETYSGWTYNGWPITTDGNNYYLNTNDSTLSGAGQGDYGTYVFCFVRGTLITTPEGVVAVETLKIGDQVLNTAGQAVPVKWIGRQTLHPTFARIGGAMPVRIAAGALGDGLPRRDLLVSPDHAILVDGVLVHALALVNGASIEQVKVWPHENVEYFHIELDKHDLVLAEGTAAETYVDNASRKRFDNWQEYLELYGEESMVPELSLPRVKNRRQLSTFTRKRLMSNALKSTQEVA